MPVTPSKSSEWTLRRAGAAEDRDRALWSRSARRSGLGPAVARRKPLFVGLALLLAAPQFVLVLRSPAFYRAEAEILLSREGGKVAPGDLVSEGRHVGDEVFLNALAGRPGAGGFRKERLGVEADAGARRLLIVYYHETPGGAASLANEAATAFIEFRSTAATLAGLEMTLETPARPPALPMGKRRVLGPWIAVVASLTGAALGVWFVDRLLRPAASTAEVEAAAGLPALTLRREV